MLHGNTISFLKAQAWQMARPAVRFFRPAPPSHLRPVSRRWGYERGTAIGRWYIDEFMKANRQDVTGAVLEIKNKRYTEAVGSNVTRADVLDIDATNSAANIITDLAQADCVPNNQYDCFILTETLLFIFDVHSAIRHSHRILKSNGVLLASVPHIAPQDQELADVDYWRFTKRGCERLFGDVFGPGNVHIEPYGNFASCISSLSGVAVEELPMDELVQHDGKYTQGIFIRACKRV